MRSQFREPKLAQIVLEKVMTDFFFLFAYKKSFHDLFFSFLSLLL